MIHGNIIVSPRPDPEMILPDGICSACDRPCRTVEIDNSYDDEFGTIVIWNTGSDCCEAEVIDELSDPA
ncbi:hypothetical protein LCGC14_2300900 [marine sediment metagenome]|uniref:Uncharacterized protein n=1 Tax=marine sediment metagenome TaxID=412755 RepID=A0A0F9F0X8_9ZZZZ